MRFLQTGDIHVGECRSLEGYLERHESVLNQITALAARKQLPLVIAGDIFHSKTTSHEERFIVDRWFSSLDHHRIPTIIIAGNHDHLYGETTQIDGYAELPFKYLQFATWHPKSLRIGNTGFICLSWQNYSTEDLATIVKRKLRELEDCRYKVVVLHECVAGVKLDSGYVLPKGTAIPNIPEVTYWAIGDIHSHQQTNVPNSYYAGAPAQFKFDDKEPKGLIEVDLENPSALPEFYRLESKPLRTVSSVDEINGDAYYKIKGRLEDVLKANRETHIVKTEFVKTEEDVLDYEKIGITHGLPEFLASKGLDTFDQQRAVEWVQSVLKER